MSFLQDVCASDVYQVPVHVKRAVVWVLGLKPGFSPRVASAPKHRATSPASLSHFFVTVYVGTHQLG